MQIDRLIGILSVLMQMEKTTAPYLAERFEVSRRTISRDIDTLCRAGIPLRTVQGKNGGISVEKGYKIDSKLLTGGELEAILIGLEGMDSVAEEASYRRLAEKLQPKSNRQKTPFHIDLASFYKESLAPKINLLEKAIRQTKIVSFYYYGYQAEGEREVEPYLLVYRWSSWYLWG
ncbi:MAG: HTH domain-containing protein, partial [Oscillospiraceae bacterium]|nr:HTH domain-containing protein [Oscillospiraceae bacterium]